MSMKAGISDVPIDKIENDDLALGGYVKALANFIRSTPTPMTIGIQGPWGSGKTSLMKLVCSEFEECEILPLWINTWKYAQAEPDDSLPIAVFLGIINALKGGAPELAPEFVSMGSRVFKSLACGLVRKYTGADLEKVLEPGQFEEVLQRFDGIEKLKDNLKALVERVTEGGSRRILVCVDDLDRIRPSRAIEILEILKLFLDVEGMVFLLACDYEVVAQGLEKKLGERVAERRGRSYFDKMVQVPFQMPLESYNTDRYLRALLEGVAALDDALISNLREALEATVGLNPRAIKRVVNILHLLMLMPDHEKEPQDAAAMFVLVAIEQGAPALYQHIARNAEEWRKGVDSGEVLEDDAGPSKEQLQQVAKILSAVLGKDSNARLARLMRVTSVSAVGPRSQAKKRPKLSREQFFDRLTESRGSTTKGLVEGLIDRLSKLGLRPTWGLASGVSIRVRDPRVKTAFTAAVFTIKGTFYLGWLESLEQKGFPSEIARDYHSDVTEIVGAGRALRDYEEVDVEVLRQLEKQEAFLATASRFLQRIREAEPRKVSANP